MALENVLERLARAVECQGEGRAVAEIIRQRDEAIEMGRRTQNQCDWAENRRNQYYTDLQKAHRRISALQGVITRMKRKAVK